MDVYDYSVEVGLPYRHVQIDSWYTNISLCRHIRCEKYGDTVCVAELQMFQVVHQRCFKWHEDLEPSQWNISSSTRGLCTQWFTAPTQ